MIFRVRLSLLNVLYVSWYVDFCGRRLCVRARGRDGACFHLLGTSLPYHQLLPHCIIIGILTRMPSFFFSTSPHT